MRKLILIILSSLLLLSCTDTIPKGRVIVVSVASDYTDESLLSNLKNPPNDQAAFIEEMRKLAGDNLEIHMFRTSNMKSYYSTDPVFDLKLEKTTIYNNSGKSWESFRIPFLPEKGNTREMKWTLANVANLLVSLGNDTEDEDLIIFHYSGHGLEDGSITTSVTADHKYLTLKTETLIDIFGDMKGTKLLIMDSCYSGEYINNTMLSSDYFMVERYTNNHSRSDLFILNTLFASLSDAFKIAFGGGFEGNENTYVLSASSIHQQSFDYHDEGLPNQRYFGAFSYYILKAMGFDFEKLTPGIRQSPMTLYSLYSTLWHDLPLSFKFEQTPRVTLSPIDVILF